MSQDEVLNMLIALRSQFEVTKNYMEFEHYQMDGVIDNVSNGLLKLIGACQLDRWMNGVEE